jgi:hypothetical protein
MEDPKAVVTLAVQMASPLDGTDYVQPTLVDATTKKASGDDDKFKLLEAERGLMSGGGPYPMSRDSGTFVSFYWMAEKLGHVV